MTKQIRISGRMTVKNLKAQFKSAFVGTLKVYHGAKFADDDATLASVRKVDNKGGEFQLNSEMKIREFEKKMMEAFGIRVQVANSDKNRLLGNDVLLSKSGI